MAILEVHDLCKIYRKTKRPALDGLTFQVEEGAVYAFVGPNGAGKTTTIRILATLLSFDAGQVRIAGYPVDTQPGKVRRLLGYIPDEFGLYGDMLVAEYLDFFARCYQIAPEKRAGMVDDLLDLVGLVHRHDDAVRTLSRGMRQRLGLARALVHDPTLIVADEPAAGLDPRARVELREIFKVLQEMGKTIFLSSHVLRELDDVATHVGIVEEGYLVASGTIQEIHARLRPHHQVRIVFLTPESDVLTGSAGAVIGDLAQLDTEASDVVPRSLDDAHAWLMSHPDVLSVEVQVQGNHDYPAQRTLQQKTLPTRRESNTLLVTLDGTEETIVRVLAELVEAGFPVLSYTEERETLESMFLNLTRGVVS
jgi:ABC-2 type transport system ATP-binding protein